MTKILRDGPVLQWAPHMMPGYLEKKRVADQRSIAERRHDNRGIMLECQQLCIPGDLVRFRSGAQLSGVAYVNEVFIWEPDRPYAADVVQVVTIEDVNGEPMIYCTSARDGTAKTFGNDLSRFREAAVRSILKGVPDWSLRDGGIN